MVIEESLYLEHYGKKGMHWGQRRAKNKALNKSRSRSQKVVSGVAVVGAVFLGSRLATRKTMNTKMTIVAGVTAGVATKKMMDHIFEKSGDKKVSELSK